ncbi:MAG: UvrD-helicase domain-containing protein, partial [Thermodesulfobacteriota bacterium]|nr:UvrD-helicase domain-containing protein [Thermodesulfobacteriota bacterium]
MKRLDLINTGLEGVHLIEASAGTGKTYTLSLLFLRLILEKNLPLEKILVVTYTIAATDELKDRIRKDIQHALHILQGTKPAEGNIGKIVEKIQDKKKAAISLEYALGTFDNAAIFTIHGFCLRLLKDMAFETAMPFDPKISKGEDNLIEEVAYDFIRKHFYTGLPEAFISYALSQKAEPKVFVSLTNMAVPDMKVIPDTKRPDIKGISQEVSKCFLQMKKQWDSHTIKELLLNAGLDGRKYQENSI